MLLAPIGVIALLAMAVKNDDIDKDGTDKGTRERVLSPDCGSDNHLSPPRSSSERVGIALELSNLSRQRTRSDVQTAGKQQRLRSRAGSHEGAAEKSRDEALFIAYTPRIAVEIFASLTMPRHGNLALTVLFVTLFIQNMTLLLNGGEIVTGDIEPVKAPLVV